MSTPRVTFIDVILPLAIPKTYTYAVPEDVAALIKFGVRVEVPVKQKLYAAIVVGMRHDLDLDLVYKPRDIISVIDEVPLISEQQYIFWQWIAEYYCCTIGEVMGVALPSGLKLSSETKVVISDDYDGDVTDLNDQEFLIAEALSMQQELTIEQIQDITDRKTVYPYIRTLLDKRAIYIKEELKQKYKPKEEAFVELVDPYLADPSTLTLALDLVSKSERQTNAILAYYQLSRQGPSVRRAEVTKLADVDSSVIKAIEKKGIWRIYNKVVSRIHQVDTDTNDASPMSAAQQITYDAIKAAAPDRPTLLHGITGSGKTRLYMELIKETLDRGQQVLFLVPEIALTTQIVARVSTVFGNKVNVYHSRLSNNQRVELWNAVYEGLSVVLGARSALYLPYQDLGLIIVDEEHDSSYKQQDPAPRYNARDAAVYLSALTGAHILLGSATPSLESFLNAQDGKYHYVALSERYGAANLPSIEIVDLRKAYRSNAMKGMVSLTLYRAMEQALDRKEQILLFQNRRGYSTSIQCTVCGWVADCPNCDLTLTLHQYFDELKCHCCGHRARNPKDCPACGNDEMKKIGFGTEKVEDDIAELFPEAVVKRMDYDTVRTRVQFEELIHNFEQRKIDILVGTQMVTKGLDFAHISVVGVLNADTILHFPDFRAGERGYQLLTQVAGRAGRADIPGKVFIQTFQPDHPVLQETIAGAYIDFTAREASERQTFTYPPFYRLIQIQLRHKKPHVVEEAAKIMGDQLKARLGNRVLGPAAPGVARLRGYYLQNLTIKMEKSTDKAAFVKKLLLIAASNLKNAKGYKSVRVVIDVDPY